MIRVHIDKITVERLNLIVLGWAFDEAGAPAEEVLLRAGKRELNAERRTISRPDLVRHFPHASPDAGFHLSAGFRNQAEMAEFILSDPVLTAGVGGQVQLPLRPHLTGLLAHSLPTHHDDYLRGRDFLNELIRTPLISEFSVVFDVGANRGDYARYLAAHLPDVTIHAFEPVGTTFALLHAAVGDRPTVHCNPFALGDMPGTAQIGANPGDVNNSIVESSSTGATETIEIRRGDDYCRERNIARIDMLKVDTEGYDLNVLMGFSRMLHERRIKLVQVEAGMNRRNRKHVELARLTAFLIPFGFEWFGFYEQVREYNHPAGALRRVDAVLVNESAIGEATGVA